MYKIDTHFYRFSELCLDLESRMTDEKWMAKDRIHRKGGCDQNFQLSDDQVDS